LEIGLGAGSFVGLAAFISGIWRTTKRLSSKYLAMPNHAEKLGLQAIIGKDLKELLAGWIPQKRFPFDPALWLVPLVLWLIAASAWWQLDHAPPIIKFFVYFGVYTTAALGFFFLLSGTKNPSKVLLIVDDLDRCQPKQLLSVMESIKVLIEDPEISSRVQVAMLIEEDVFKQAVVKKYKRLAKATNAQNIGPGWSLDRIIREAGEKLFTAHFRMPPLNEQETKEVLRNVLKKDEKVRARQKTQKKIREIGLKKIVNIFGRAAIGSVQSSVNADTSGNSDLQEVELQDAYEQLDEEGKKLKAKIASPNARLSSPINKSLSAMTFSKEEEEALSNALPLLTAKHVSACGPRTIRAFVFRYQLARLLLNRLKAAWEPGDLARGLADNTPSSLTGLSEEVQRVINQVS